MAATEHLRHHVRPPTEIESYSGLPRSDAVTFAWCRGALFATGPAIDAIAAALSDAVPPACREARERRDGASHHITLIPKIEAPDATQEPDVLEELARCPFVPLGLATASRAWFIPCLWPAAQAHRAALGLPPCDFHITLGFDGADVHGIRKGPLQLLPPWSGTSLGLPEAPASALRHTWRPVVCGVLRLCADAVRRDAAAASDLLAALDRLENDGAAAGKAAAVAELQCTRGSVLGAIGRTAVLPCAAQPRAPVAAVRMAGGGPGPESKDGDGEEDSLYDVDFSLDATTVLALLGGAIAFNFFVLANL